MKKGKAIEDNQLDNVQGGGVLRRDYVVRQAYNDSRPHIASNYTVIDEMGNELTEAYCWFGGYDKDIWWRGTRRDRLIADQLTAELVQGIARNMGQSDEIITENDYLQIFGRKPPEKPL